MKQFFVRFTAGFFLVLLITTSAGARVLYGLYKGETDGGDLIDIKADATGIAPIFGFSWKAAEALSISCRHEMRPKLEYELDTLKIDDSVIKGLAQSSVNSMPLSPQQLDGLLKTMDNPIKEGDTDLFQNQ